MPESAVVSDLRSKYAFALQGRFPDLSVEQLSLNLEPGGDLIGVDWREWQALFPRSEGGAEQLAAVAAVMPHLRGFLSPAIPLWDVSSEGEDWPRSWRAARRLDGRPLLPELIVDQNRERLVRDLAAFFHELHSFSVERARSLGAASFRSWRDEHEALARRAQSVLRPLLSWSEMTWARRWWSRFLNDDSIWKHEPALVHGSIDADCLLVDPLVQELAAVTGWQRMRVADPALDFAHLVDAYGTELVWRIVERYGELGSTADAGLFRRIRLQQTVRRFQDVVDAAERDSVESESVAAALTRLR